MRTRTILLWTTVAAFAIAAALGIVSILTWTIGPAEERMITSALLIGLFSLAALLCVLVIDKYRLVPLMWLGVVASCLAAVFWMIVIWGEPFVAPGGVDFTERLVKPAVTLSILAAWAAHLGLMTLPRMDWSSSRAVRLATLVLSTLCGLAVTTCLWIERFEMEEGRLILVTLVLAVCGTFVAPTLALVEAMRRRNQPEDIESKVRVELFCPRCGKRQHVHAGARRCASCGLRVTLQVEEPRCRCGYLLYHLQGDACPECGRAVPGAGAWDGDEPDAD